MINEQQTLVDWFKKELEDYGSNSHLSLDWNTFDELCQQAKEMEKQQKADTWNNAINAVEKDKWESFEQYYNETYGGNK